MKYNVNISTLIRQLLPFRLRVTRVISVLQSILLPLQQIYDSLITYRNQKQYEMAISSQVIYLEKLLNDTFNPLSNYSDIYITDSLDYNLLIYMGNVGELNAEVYLGNVYDDYQEYYFGEEVIYNNLTWQSIDNSFDHVVPGTNPAFWQYPNGIEEAVVFIGNADDYNLGTLFTINIDQTLYYSLLVSDRLSELNSLIDKYKIFGSTYKIIVI